MVEMGSNNGLVTNRDFKNEKRIESVQEGINSDADIGQTNMEVSQDGKFNTTL